MALLNLWKDITKAPFNMINSFLHPERGYDAASEALREAQMRGEGFQRPFMEAGQNQIGRLTGAEDALLNPAELQNKWAAGYTTSPYAMRLQEQAKNSGLDAASSMGLLGSSAALGSIQNTSSDIMNRDRQNYMNDLMQKYLSGIGIGQNIYGTGASTASNMGGHALNYGENFGQMAFGSKNAPGEQFAQILGMLARIAAGKDNPAGKTGIVA